MEPWRECETPRVQSPPATASPRRRHARVAASWPVTIQTGDRLLHLQTLNLSSLGVKVGMDEPLRREPLEVGCAAHLRLEPPGARALEVEAIVWRADADGPAFFFIEAPHAEPSHAR